MSYIIKHSASSVLVLDKDLRYIYASQVDFDGCKPKPEDIIGKYHYDMNPGLPQKWRDVHQRCLKGEIITDDNDPFYRADGTIDWTKWECRPWYETDGSIGGIIIYTEIITDRKNAVESLEKSEERFRIMFEESPLGIGLFDFKSGKAEHINKKFKEIIGRDNEEVLDFDWQTITHPDDMVENLRLRELVLSGEITGFNMRKRYYKSDRKIIWINLTVTLLDSINESNPKEICMIEDMSKQIEREEKILYLSNVDSLTDVYNRSFFETEKIRLDVERQLPLSVIVFDIDGLKLINDTFGYSSGDKLLKAAGNIIKKCCRVEDIICRVGGDEFFILLPQTTELESGNICARIQCFAESHEVTFEDSCLKLSLSMGYSTKTLGNEDFSEIITNAENSMRRKKLLERKSVRSDLITLVKVTMIEKSHETAEHAERLVNLSRAIGKEINLSDNDMFMLELASSLHDIGKMCIDQQILEKPEKLTVQEWNEIKKHPETGYRIAQATSELMPISEYILA
ncbi:MAG: diguanylate cyclase, partial [Peptostreptococcaceae bacterium]|nr:diguanylate cyclase [Peptostreptococcaceae bacterium]